MFDKDFKITGKHANYWKDLCVLAGNVPDREEHNNFKIFNAYIDAYIVCPIIGYQYNRKATIDNSVEGNAGMLAEVISKRSAELKYVYQILMLVDEDSEPDVDKRVFRAFNFSENTAEEKAMIAENMKLSPEEAIKKLYASKLYTALENEETKVWQYSTQMLYSLLEQEEKTGSIIFPDV